MKISISTMPTFVTKKSNKVADLFEQCAEYVQSSIEDNILEPGIYTFRLNFECVKEED